MGFIRKLFFTVYKPFVSKKIYRTSVYKWKDIILHIPAGVFHPSYFFSTKFLLEYLLRSKLQNRRLLELGAGSGLISIACAKQGAIVTSSDISKRVVDSLQLNAKSNRVELTILHSDLFDAIPPQQFDIIAINPPYYPINPRNELEQAWYCGEHFEYFEKLFSRLGEFMHAHTEVLMVLSEDCNLDKLFGIASKNHFNFNLLVKKKFWWEQNMIYSIQRVEGH